jgi:hypothetical protein
MLRNPCPVISEPLQPSRLKAPLTVFSLMHRSRLLDPDSM